MAEDGLPKSTLQKHIKDKLPENMRIAGEALDLVVQCCNEFVMMISTQANSISEKDKKTTITPEHIVKALEELDFTPYLGAVNQAWDEFKDGQKEATEKANSRKQARGGTGMSVEEMKELQQKLFEQARQRTLSTEIDIDLAAVGIETAAEPQQQQQQQQQEAAANDMDDDDDGDSLNDVSIGPDDQI